MMKKKCNIPERDHDIDDNQNQADVLLVFGRVSDAGRSCDRGKGAGSSSSFAFKDTCVKTACFCMHSK